jgi:hypothetical protein
MIWKKRTWIRCWKDESMKEKKWEKKRENKNWRKKEWWAEDSEEVKIGVLSSEIIGQGRKKLTREKGMRLELKKERKKECWRRHAGMGCAAICGNRKTWTGKHVKKKMKNARGWGEMGEQERRCSKKETGWRMKGIWCMEGDRMWRGEWEGGEGVGRGWKGGGVEGGGKVMEGGDNVWRAPLLGWTRSLEWSDCQACIHGCPEHGIHLAE